MRICLRPGNTLLAVPSIDVGRECEKTERIRANQSAFKPGTSPAIPLGKASAERDSIMKLELNVRRTRSSIRSDVNTGSVRTRQSGSTSYGGSAGLPPEPPKPTSVLAVANASPSAAY